MTFPTVTVEVSATDAGLPAYEDIVWTDVSASSAEADVALGRSDELAEYGAGTLSLRMNSPDPLEVGWLIRVRATADATELPLFCGRITSLVKAPEPGSNLVRVALEATDLTEAIAAVGLTRSPYAKAIAADGPLRFWPLDGTEVGYSSKARHATGLVDAENGSAMKLSESYDWLRTPGVPLDASGGFTVEFWIRTRTTVRKNTIAPIFSKSVFATTEPPVSVGITSEGLLFGVGSSANVSAVGISDGRTHHVVCTYAAGTRTIWIDGHDCTWTAPTMSASRWRADASSDTVLGYRRKGDFCTPLTGTLDEVALYPYALTSDQIEAHHALGRQGETATTLTDRVTDLLALADLDASWINAHASANETDVFTKPVFEGTLAAELQSLATAHASRIHTDSTGRLALFGFDYFPTPVAHFSDEGDHLDYLAAGFELAVNRDDIANTVTGSQVDGPTLTASDPDSIARYGSHERDVGTVRTSSPGAVQTIIERHLDRYAVPVERYRSISLAPMADDDLWPAVADSNVSATVTVTYDGTTADYVVEGITHSIGPQRWTTTLSLSPAPVDDFWRWAEAEFDTETRWA